MKVTYAMRMPPGDRWKIGDDSFESLTACLNEIFLREGVTNFIVDAGKGEVLIDDGKKRFAFKELARPMTAFVPFKLLSFKISDLSNEEAASVIAAR